MSSTSIEREGFRHSGFFVIRTPLLPFDEYALWSEGCRTVTPSDAYATPDFVGHIAQNKQVLRNRLRDIVSRPEIKEALFLASPTTEADLKHWYQNPETKNGKRVERTLVKYFARMTTRCTPFGLFAGNSVGPIGTETQLVLDERSAYRRHTRLDMEYLSALVDAVTKDPVMREKVVYRPNSSLYSIGDAVRYAEARLSGRVRNYVLVAARSDQFLTRTLERARQGASCEQLAELLIDDEISHEDARGYLYELIAAQILVPDVAPAVTGAEAIGPLICQLEALDADGEIVGALREAKDQMEDMDRHGLGTPPTNYRELAFALKSLPADADIARLFQVDMVKPTRLMEMSEDTVADVRVACDVLYSLFGNPGPDSLSDFRKAFTERYQDREVPLFEVLDEDIGIGFLSTDGPDTATCPLLQGVGFPGRFGDSSVVWRAWMDLLQRKLFECVSNRSEELVLTEEDLQPFRSHRHLPLPDAFAVIGAVLGPVENESTRNRLLVSGVWGPSGVRMLGRFCHADEELWAYVRRHVKEEESVNTDALYCEIVHLPDGRVGNILARPVLRDYEIVFLGCSGADADKQIRIDDLTLRVVGDRAVLRSRSLDREVIPRLSTAHNTRNRSTPMYRFLAALQDQGLTGGVAWTWGRLQGLPQLPRVRYKNIVLSLRTWNLKKADIDRIAATPLIDSVNAVQRMRAEWQIPRYVGLVDGDNVLTVDLENVLCIEAFIDLIEKRQQVVLEEQLELDELVVDGPEGRFRNEFLLPFLNSKQLPTNTALKPKDREHLGILPFREEARLRTPGSEWLYAKIYCGAATADRILVDVVADVVRETREAHLIDDWFFVRYADPHSHLRVRFHLLPGSIGGVVSALDERLKPFVRSRLLWKIQYDSYDREIGRYGGVDCLAICERAFCIDSDAVVAMLNLMSGDDGANLRWKVALKSTHLLLDDFGFDVEKQIEIIALLAGNFAREHGLVGKAKQPLLDKYRAVRAELAKVLGNDDDTLIPAARVLADRSRRLRPVFEELKRHMGDGKTGATLDEVAASIVHMCSNRLLRPPSRPQEAVIYNILEREYASRKARLGPSKQRVAV